MVLPATETVRASPERVRGLREEPVFQALAVGGRLDVQVSDVGEALGAGELGQAGRHQSVARLLGVRPEGGRRTAAEPVDLTGVPAGLAGR